MPIKITKVNWTFLSTEKKKSDARKRLGATLVAFATIFGVLTGAWSVRPKPSITPASVMRQGNPLSAAFLVGNAGEWFAMRDVNAGCEGKVTYKFSLVKPKTTVPMFRVTTDRTDKIDPGKSFTAFCNVGLETTPPVPAEITEMHILFKIKYGVRFWPPRREYQRVFDYALDEHGQLQWITRE